MGDPILAPMDELIRKETTSGVLAKPIWIEAGSLGYLMGKEGYKVEFGSARRNGLSVCAEYR